MTTTTQRASLAELTKFANKVREAGGGNPLDALMPAVPGNSERCLIAKNLNFNCFVDSPYDDGWWYMSVEDENIAKQIGEALGLPVNEAPFEDRRYAESDQWMIRLPDEIGRVAYDFDRAGEMVSAVTMAHYRWENDLGDEDKALVFKNDFRNYAEEIFFDEYDVDGNELDFDLVMEMWPYINESVKEAQTIGVFDDEGRLILQLNAEDINFKGIWKLFEPRMIDVDEHGFTVCPFHGISHNVKYLCAGCAMDRERNI